MLSEEDIEFNDLEITPGDSEPANNDSDLVCPPGQRAQFVCVSGDNPNGYATGGGQDGGGTDNDIDETTGGEQHEFQTGKRLGQQRRPRW